MSEKTEKKRAARKPPVSTADGQTPPRRATWLFGYFLLSAVMFTLGVLTGRGTAPVRFDIEAFENKVLGRKAEMAEQELARYRVAQQDGSQEENLGVWHLKDEGVESVAPPPVPIPLKKAKFKKEIPADADGVKPPEPELDTEPAPAPSPARLAKTAPSPAAMVVPRLALQVASLKDEQGAIDMVKRLKSKKYRAYHVASQLADGSRYFRVRIGPYVDRAAATRDLIQLRLDKFRPMVIQLKGDAE